MHDHPGYYRVIPIEGIEADQLRREFDQAQRDGYEWLAMNDTLAVFYKTEK